MIYIKYFALLFILMKLNLC